VVHTGEGLHEFMQNGWFLHRMAPVIIYASRKAACMSTTSPLP
jgi:hypothetical protein